MLRKLLLIAASVLAFAASAIAQPSCWQWSPLFGRWVFVCEQPQQPQPYRTPAAPPGPPATQNVPPANERGALIYAQPRTLGPGSNIFIKGMIVPGDERKFAALNPPPPVYVRPIGPGGSEQAAFAIADMIWQRGYSTAILRNDGGCASACTTIWLSGRHVIVELNSDIEFHSCWSGDPTQGTDHDDLACDLDVAAHLMKYGYTQFQAYQLAYAAPHRTTRLATVDWALNLGFHWQTLRAFPGAVDYCTARICVAVP